MVSGAKEVLNPAFSIYDESDEATHDLGDYTWVGDRMFRFCRNGDTILTPGTLAIAADPVGGHQNALLSATVAAGGRVLTPTFATTAVTVDQYKDGYCCINKATGFGAAYRVKSNPAAGIAATCAITLYDDLEKAVDTTTEVSLAKNKYDNVIVLPTGAITNVPVGYALLDVAATYYFWCQVLGPCACLCDTGETLVIGETCGVQDTVEVAGAVGLRDDQTTINVGNVMYIAVAAEYALIDLELA